MSAILHYFDGRGKAEIIRLTMAATGIKVLFFILFFCLIKLEVYSKKKNKLFCLN